MRTLRPLALALVLLAGFGAATGAQSSEDLPLPERMDRALREMMEGLKPSLDEALDYLRSFNVIDDPRHYELPEVLPNGDIIIRRREDAPEFRPDDPEDLPIDPEDGIRT